MANRISGSDDRDWRSRLDMRVVEQKAEVIDRDAFRAASISEARSASSAFPDLITDILGIFREAYPPQIIATIAFWGLIHAGGPQGFSTTGMIKNVEQHHIELLQALLLVLDADEWGCKPASTPQIQRTIDAVLALSSGFHRRRALQLETYAADPDRLAVAVIQERVRDYTQMVRNWSTHSEMLRIVRAIHAPLDALFEVHQGYSASDLIDVVDALVALHQERASGHFSLMKSIFSARSKKAMVHEFFSRFEGVEGDPDAFLASLPKRMRLRDIKTILNCHADRWLVTYMCVDPEVLAMRTGKPSTKIAKIFHTLSLGPGSLCNSNIEHFFLANPIWSKPGMRVGQEFTFFAPQGIVGFLQTILRDLFGQVGLGKELEKRRAAYLEGELVGIVGSALPTASLRSNVKWKWRGVEYETDLIAVVDRVLLLGEAKSGALTAGALRGGPRSARDHVQELLAAPAEQSGRLRDILLAARMGNPDALELATALNLGLDPTKIDYVVRLSVTLDDFSALSSAQAELKRAGWITQDTDLPPTMQLAELRTVTDILDDPAIFLNYLLSRAAIQAKLPVFGFEHDFLGAYLKSGLDHPEITSGTHKGIFSNMSYEIDRYHLSAGAGYDSMKPRPLIDPYVADVLAHLRKIEKPGWLTKSIALLDAIPPGHCNDVGGLLDDIAVEVDRNCRNCDQQGTVALCGPGRRAVAMFHVFPGILRKDLNKKLAVLAEKSMIELEADTCVIIARALEQWNLPFVSTSMMWLDKYPPTSN